MNMRLSAHDHLPHRLTAVPIMVVAMTRARAAAADTVRVRKIVRIHLRRCSHILTTRMISVGMMKRLLLLLLLLLLMLTGKAMHIQTIIPRPPLRSTAARLAEHW